MNRFLQNVFLLFLVGIPGWFCNIQTLQGQTVDSLKNMLTYVHENTGDEKIRMAVKEALSLYKNNMVTDSLSAKLLKVEDVVLNSTMLNPRMNLSFAEMIVHLLRQLPPQEENPHYGRSLNNLGNLYIAMGEYNKALPIYQQALAIAKKVQGETHPDYATSLHNLARLYLHTGEYKKAMPLFRQSMAIRKRILGEEHPDYASSLSSLGNLYLSLAEHEKAKPLFQQALMIRKKLLGQGHPDYANSLTDMAVLYAGTGQYDKALPFQLQALAIRKKVLGEEHPDYNNSVNDLAILYYYRSEYEKALPLYQQALAITKKIQGDTHPDYATSLHNLAVLYNEMEEYEKALPLYQEALAIRKRILGEEHPDYAFSLNSLAYLYEDIGQFDKALPLYQQALMIRKKVVGEEHPDYASSLNNLASLYHSMKQYDKALPLYQQALQIRKKTLGENHREYASSLNNLAFVYEDMGEYKKALPFYLQSLAIRKKVLGEKHPAYATNLTNLAFLYYRLGQYEKAQPLYEQALAIRKNALGEEHPDYATSCNNLGLLYSNSGNDTGAVALFIKASTIKLKHLANTYSSLSEQEKMVFLNKELSPFSILPSLLFNTGQEQPAILQQAYANELVLKGMVLEDQQHVLQNIRKSGDSSSLQLYEQWRLNKIFAGKQLLLPLARRVPFFDSLQEVTTQLEQQLSRRAASFHNQLQSHIITAKDISRKLAKDEVAVEFLRFKLYNKKWTDSMMYAALILSPGDSIASFIPLFEEKQLQRLLSPPVAAVRVDAVIQQLYRGVIVSGSETGSLQDSLYQLIWKPLEKYLAGMNTVYYAPAGLLHRIAIQALRPDSNHLLIDKYQLNQVLSTRAVALPARLSEKPASASIWGNIQYDLQSGYMASRGADAKEERLDTTASSFNFYTADTKTSRGEEWNALPGTKQEMDSLENVLLGRGIDITTNSGTVATEEAFKDLNGRSPQLLHLATHGFFLPVATTVNDRATQGNVFTVQQNPMFRSGLVLAGANQTWKGEAAIPGREDGILTAYEIAQMDLGNTDLVVLSACETALGDLQGNEGVIGLQRAFKMAGVKQMIMSLWRVPDKETMELITIFYKNWLGGQSTREALRAAQLKMKEKYPPYYWAAFVVVE